MTTAEIKIVDRACDSIPEPTLGSVCIFDRTAETVARVWVFDYPGQVGSRMRFSVQKIMRLANGQTRNTHTYYARRSAAIAYAKRWIDGRIAALAGAAQEAA